MSQHPEPALLTAEMGIDRPGFRLDLTVVAHPGEVIALLGPNGAGKSTAVRALTGLEPLSRGSVTLDGHVLEEPAAGTRMVTERRPVGVVFQDYLLFPHLSALDNVAFGPRARGATRSQARDLARHWLDRVGLAEQATAKPRALSGGQAQRVALARALVTAPRLLLLDEPLTALDARTRLAVRADLRAHLDAFDGVAIVVTHDPLDAMVLADRVIVIEDGTVTQQGTPTEVARQPRTDYVARLIGLNLYRGTARRGAIELQGGGELAVSEPIDGAVYVTFPPSAVALFTDRPHGTPRNCWPVTVHSIEERTDLVRIRLDGTPDVLADVTAAAVADLRLAPGTRLWAAVKATEAHAYPA